MKRHYRLRYMLNLFSLGLLLFALYLNFVKKEATESFTPAGTENSSAATNLKKDAISMQVQSPHQEMVSK